MPAYLLRVFFPGDRSFELGKFDSPKLAEDQKDEIFENGYSYKSYDMTVYYPASSILKAEITYYKKMEADKT